jgi:hypothetical protein
MSTSAAPGLIALHELYVQLLTKSSTIDISKQLWAGIGKLNIKHCEMIYFLILHDFILQGGDANKSLPYTPRVMPGGKGVLFSVDKQKLPERTQGVVIAYLIMISS